MRTCMKLHEGTAVTAENYRKMTRTVLYTTLSFNFTVRVMVRLTSYTAVFIRPYADTVRRAALGLSLRGYIIIEIINSLINIL